MLQNGFALPGKENQQGNAGKSDAPCPLWPVLLLHSERALAAAPVRLRTASLPRTEGRLDMTVDSATKSFRPISRLESRPIACRSQRKSQAIQHRGELELAPLAQFVRNVLFQVVEYL